MKYKLLENKQVVKNLDGVEKTLYQIEALRDFKDGKGRLVRTGQRGGWVQSERNLSHNDGCWIDEKSYLFDESLVRDNAVLKNSTLYAQSSVKEDAFLGGSTLTGRSSAKGTCSVIGSTLIGDTLIGFDAYIDGCTLTNVHLSLALDGGIGSRAYMEKVTATGKVLISIDSACHWVNSTIEVAEANIQKTVSLRNTTIRKVYLWEVREVTFISNTHIELSDESTLAFYSNTGTQTKIEGIPNELIRMKEGNYVRFGNTMMKGAITIEGEWDFTNSKISGMACFINKGGIQTIADSTISEFATIEGTDDSYIIKNKNFKGDGIYKVEDIGMAL
ncbi:hypothetical protein [Rossellomorea marisflavi]|uniref:hypothetical protein n=1 Tax=Rossellomorea marisflavi TaxID=189381 RepID=UPI003F9F7CE9